MQGETLSTALNYSSWNGNAFKETPKHIRAGGLGDILPSRSANMYVYMKQRASVLDQKPKTKSKLYATAKSTADIGAYSH